jgi:hypothetical protein
LSILFSKNTEHTVIALIDFRIIISLFIEKPYIHKELYTGTLKLDNLGLSLESAKTLRMIMKNNFKVKRLELGSNNLGDEGVKVVMGIFKGGQKSGNQSSVIHLGLGSNRLKDQGMIEVFDSLKGNQTLVSLDVSAKDRSKLNKIETTGLWHLSNLLKTTSSIAFLDLSLL